MGFTVGAIIVEGAAEAAVAAEIAAASMAVGEVAASSVLIAAGTDVAGMAALDSAAMAAAGEAGLTAGAEAAGTVGMDAVAAESGSLAVGADGADIASLAGNSVESGGLTDMGAEAVNSAVDPGLTSTSLPDVAASNSTLTDYGTQAAAAPDAATSSITPQTTAAPTGPDVPGATASTTDAALGAPASSDPATLAADEFGGNSVNQYGTGAATPTPAGFNSFLDYMKSAAKFAKANPMVVTGAMQLGGGALKGMATTSAANKNRAVLQQTADINAARVKQGSYGSDVAGYTPIIASRRI